MRRTDPLVLVALAVLVGCMRIYPDPDLPDVVVEWTEFDCRDGTGDVVVALVAVDDGARVEAVAPCSALEVSFPDVDRVQYRVEGELRGPGGMVFSRADGEADLRNGINKRVYLYFGGFSNFRVGWTFANGETCASLSATSMSIRLSTMGQVQFAFTVPCNDLMFFGTLPFGRFTAGLHALADDTTVATSPESAEFVIDEIAFVDLGIVELSP